jgi:nickel/cobalt transporter (NiCoT) family protein
LHLAVVLGFAAIAGAARSLEHSLIGLRAIGGLVGTLVSALFLFAIAIVNLVILRSVFRAFRKVRRGEFYCEEEFGGIFGSQGFLARIFRPIFTMISRSGHMYPLGILFGLGFDTATEIGLLGISAAEASKGLSIWLISVYPILFAAGMSLIDSTDNVLMLGAYGWAFLKPIRRLYYNVTITCISVLVALIVGAIEVLGLLAGHLRSHRGFWDEIVRLNRHFTTLGYFIVGLFVLSWIVSIAVYKWRRFDDVELST